MSDNLFRVLPHVLRTSPILAPVSSAPQYFKQISLKLEETNFFLFFYFFIFFIFLLPGEMYLNPKSVTSGQLFMKKL